MAEPLPHHRLTPDLPAGRHGPGQGPAGGTLQPLALADALLLMAPHGQAAAFAAAIAAWLHLPALPPPRQGVALADGRCLLWHGAAQWLLIQPGAPTALPLITQAEALPDQAAALFDLSDDRVGFALSGPLVGATLGRLLTLDLGSPDWAPGSVALVPVHGIGCVVWQHPAGDGTHWLLGPRSYAASLGHSLVQTAARDGLMVLAGTDPVAA